MALRGRLRTRQRVEDEGAHACHPLVGIQLKERGGLATWGAGLRFEVLHLCVSYQSCTVGVGADAPLAQGNGMLRTIGN